MTFVRSFLDVAQSQMVDTGIARCTCTASVMSYFHVRMVADLAQRGDRSNASVGCGSPTNRITLSNYFISANNVEVPFLMLDSVPKCYCS